LTRTIQINPKIPQAFNNRANAYRASGNLEAAIADYSELAKLAPASSFAFEQRAILLEKAGRKDDAIADYRKGLQVKPDAKIGLEALKRLGINP
jgi:tetratricopeptide (TPR) repeat protein